MLCPTCYGHRLFYVKGEYVPCPYCDGHGMLHCCEGLQAQPGDVHSHVVPPPAQPREVRYQEPAVASAAR